MQEKKKQELESVCERNKEYKCREEPRNGQTLTFGNAKNIVKSFLLVENSPSYQCFVIYTLFLPFLLFLLQSLYSACPSLPKWQCECSLALRHSALQWAKTSETIIYFFKILFVQKLLTREKWNNITQGLSFSLFVLRVRLVKELVPKLHGGYAGREHPSGDGFVPFQWIAMVLVNNGTNQHSRWEFNLGL